MTGLIIGLAIACVAAVAFFILWLVALNMTETKEVEKIVEVERKIEVPKVLDLNVTQADIDGAFTAYCLRNNAQNDDGNKKLFAGGCNCVLDAYKKLKATALDK